MENKKADWKGKTGGGNFGQRSLFHFFRFGNISVAYGIMSFVIFFFLIVNYKATKNMYSYFRNRQLYAIVKSALSVYKNHYLFGKALIDKFAFFAGRKNAYTIELVNNELFTEQANKKDEGAILLHSHLGSSEIVGYMLSSEAKTVNSIVYGGESPVYQQFREKLLTEHNIRMIPVTDEFSHIFEVNNALKANEIVSMAADRIYQGSKNISLTFLGAKARFPIAPFQLAVKMKIPILAFFVMQNGRKKYTCYLAKVNIDNQESYSIKEQTELLAKKYGSVLENMVKKYPLQWYNFHRFWE